MNSAKTRVEATNKKIHDRIIAECRREERGAGHCDDEKTFPKCLVGKLCRFREVSYERAGGGTVIVHGDFTVRTAAGWWDYETGWHYACVLVSAKTPLPDGFGIAGVKIADLPKHVRVSEHDLLSMATGRLPPVKSARLSCVCPLVPSPH
jgi:hypothetical protein